MYTNKFMSGLAEANVKFKFEKAETKDQDDRLIIGEDYYINLCLGDAFLYKFKHKGLVGVLVDIYSEQDIPKLTSDIKSSI